VYITGAGVSNTTLALPDLGFIGLSDIVQHTIAIRQATDLPLIVDADTGFGNALNVHYTVRALEQAGANAVQLEDQVMPKKCGHFASKAVVSRSEAVERVIAAVEARQDPNFQIVARTDARAVYGLDEALERAELFRKAGADIIFVEAPESRVEIEQVIAAVDAPHIVNLVIGGKTPTIGQDEAKQLGCSVLLYANVALQAAVAGMQSALGQLIRDGRVDETTPGIASFADRQRLVRKAEFDELDRRHSLP
jgi:2-methylisocitrate lyase-like PEP mutase family enzyme